MDKKIKFNVTYIIIAIIGILFIQEMWLKSSQIENIPYSEFQKLLKEQKVEEIFVGTDRITGKLKKPLDGHRQHFVTVRVDPELARQLENIDVKVTGLTENTFLQNLLSWLVPAILFFGLWFFLIRLMTKKGGLGGSFMAIGKSKAKVYVETDTKTTFDDVAGVDEAKEELQEVVSFLKSPQEYSKLGARMPKGILLVGPPGTGKTLIAKAVAGEANVPFFSISGSEFVEMFVGVGAARVRDLFEQARQKAPCIIFIDELDALGKARGAAGYPGGHDEKEQTLNQLLVELDGFDPSGGIVIISATNRPEILDPALLRAGRFDRQVLVDRPDKKGRLAILKVHIKKLKKLDITVALEKVAAITPGFTGADLANLVNEAALIATRRKASQVEMDDFTNAIERIVAGLEKRNRLLNPKEREIVAYHEMGHAIVASSGLPGVDKVHKVSIIPRGIGSLGYTIQRPEEDRYLMTKEELEAKITVLMGGRAAEKITFDHYSTGASDDINKATEIARCMVMRYGMEESLGHVNYDTSKEGFLSDAAGHIVGTRAHSEETAKEIDAAVKNITNTAFHKALKILTLEKAILDEGAQKLLLQETLTEQDLHKLFSKLKPAPKTLGIFANITQNQKQSSLTR